MERAYQIRGNVKARIVKDNRILTITDTASSAMVQAATRAWEKETGEGWERKPWKDNFLTVTVRTI